MNKIMTVHAREILDSRGYPTVEADVILDSGIIGRAAVPSGASTGIHEAVELRDNDSKRYNGKGVTLAVSNVNTLINHALHGMNAYEQTKIDETLQNLDGTANKSHLGANAILAASLAVAQAAALSQKLPLYRYLNQQKQYVLPVPQMNIINGGKHANNNLDIQEVMILPVGAPTFAEALRYGAEIFQQLKIILNKRGLATTVGDEGGFAPSLASHEEALQLIIQAIDLAGYIPGDDILLALDCASSELYNGDGNGSENGKYHLAAEGLTLTSEQFVAYLRNLADKYPLVSFEDAMSEIDEAGWVYLTQECGKQLQLVGDDNFVTNPKRIKHGIEKGIANALLVKPNQIGTLTEVCEAVKIARAANYATVMSHRSGETESTIIADLALMLGCEQIKTGSLARSERIAKYNQLLRIEEELGDDAHYLGRQAFRHLSL